jgi:hypothetical protein
MRLGELIDRITRLFDAGDNKAASDLIEAELWAKHDHINTPDLPKLKADVNGMVRAAYQRGKDGQLRFVARYAEEDMDVNAHSR